MNLSLVTENERTVIYVLLSCEVFDTLEHADCWNGHFCKFVYNKKVEIRIAEAVKCLGAKYLLPLTL